MNNETINYPFINKRLLTINYYTTIKYIFKYYITIVIGKPQGQNVLSVRVRPLLWSVTLFFYSNIDHVWLQSLYLQINRFPEIMDQPDWFQQYMSVSSRGSIWGRVSNYGYCFFPNIMLKQKLALYGYTQIWLQMSVYRARFGYPIMTPNLLHFGLKLLFQRPSEDVGTRAVIQIELPLTIKTQIRI